jgi:hypothetical protein
LRFLLNSEGWKVLLMFHTTSPSMLSRVPITLFWKEAQRCIPLIAASGRRFIEATRFPTSLAAIAPMVALLLQLLPLLLNAKACPCPSAARARPWNCLGACMRPIRRLMSLEVNMCDDGCVKDITTQRWVLHESLLEKTRFDV